MKPSSRDAICACQNDQAHVETFGVRAHIPVMTAAASMKRSSPIKKAPVYRGVKLQTTGGRTRFSLAQIRKAVEAAVAKNADVLSGGQ